MPALAWDRLLETCVRQNGDLILLADFPPYWRCEGGLRKGLIPSMSAADLGSMYEQIAPAPAEVHEVAGVRSFDLRYGSDFRFRVTVLGHSSVEAFLIARISSDVLPLSRDAGRAWQPSGDPLSWQQLLANCLRKDMRDIVLMPEYPPVLWSERGLHVFFVPALTPGDLALTVEQIVPPPENRSEVEGYLDFSIGLGPDDVFRVALFGHPSP